MNKFVDREVNQGSGDQEKISELEAENQMLKLRVQVLSEKLSQCVLRLTEVELQAREKELAIKVQGDHTPKGAQEGAIRQSGSADERG